ncbi:hypothetical protein NKDENANG_04101 [Candidatus Entotheonellaceae bacterium PAL068K]
MAGQSKVPVLVVVQLTGGNDFMNTIIPYANGIYHDSRPTVGIPAEQVLPLDNRLGFHPRTGPLKDLYEQGKVAIIQGIGYPNSNRSHFRGMDIWHTCEPHRIATAGWLGKAIRELDPQQENVLTGVSFGRGLPRAMVSPGVPVTSVGGLDNYGLMTDIAEPERLETLEIFKQMYAPAIGTGPVTDYLSQTGLDVLKGADVLKQAPATYTSEVEYPDNPIARSLRDVARVHGAELGTRIFYTQHGGYDTHASEVPTHSRLVDELSSALRAFMQDLWDHDAADEVVILVFTEFGRRIKDNGSGTDHGSGGGAFLIGERVVGGLYAEYPSLEPEQQLYGEDLRHHFDFRGVYATLLEQWLGLDATPIVGGTYEQLQPFQV